MISHPFSVRCNTGFGNAAYVRGNIKELQVPVRLEVKNDENWSINLDIDSHQHIQSDEVIFDFFIASYDDPCVNIQPLLCTDAKKSFKLKKESREHHGKEPQAKEQSREEQSYSKQEKDLGTKETRKPLETTTEVSHPSQSKQVREDLGKELKKDTEIVKDQEVKRSTQIEDKSSRDRDLKKTSHHNTQK